MEKFTLRVNYPHSERKSTEGKNKKALKKCRRLPIIAIGKKVNKKTNEDEYIVLFNAPKDALNKHVKLNQITIFHDINVISAGFSPSLNKNISMPEDKDFISMNISVNGFSKFKVFKENINAARNPVKGNKFEICGNSHCNETNNVIHKPKDTTAYICGNCWGQHTQQKKIAA